ncbi:MAG: carbamoyl phosphate synthase small subunit [Defluviitaleaceae bacterium]|nr:carbamoyl phosphate synthase small subunit [Defluviitaleaceae bacterium]
MKAYLVLESGKIFEADVFGQTGKVTGEIVFATGMTGYLETLTDPSYYGQIVMQTFPLIGNYGIIPSDFESSIVGPAAYIVKHPCQDPSNFRSEGNLDTFLKERGVLGISGLDTRELTKIIRENGVMNGTVIFENSETEIKKAVQEARSHKIFHHVARAAVNTERKLHKAENAKRTVALFDFGAKENITRELMRRDCDVWTFPYNSRADEILNVSPDGIMLSNGPGDPKDNKDIIEVVKQLFDAKIPMFGICLGHQLMALANGFQTSKLKYGHRGSNQPVKDLQTDKVYITSQNHGYAVLSHSINEGLAEEWFVNVNDKTNEGIFYKNTPAFSVQFHPEACGGPTDTEFIFDKFIGLMKGEA